jgi:hypothetical protein
MNSPLSRSGSLMRPARQSAFACSMRSRDEELDRRGGAGAEHHHLAGFEALAIDLDRAGGDMAARSAYWAGSSALAVQVKERQMHRHGRLRAESLARNQPHLFIQSNRQVMREPRIALLELPRQSHPGLDAVHAAAFAPRTLEALGVGDAAAGAHPVHVDRARQAGREVHRSHVVEEHERADHAAPGEGQHPADLEAAQVAAPLADDDFDHGKSIESCRRSASCCAARATPETSARRRAR